jgi:non-canonical (house-cleaning) NTP pyrophosphatase
MIKIAIASERKAKVDAVRLAASSIAGLGIPAWDKLELITRRTESDVAATPVDDADLMRGARSRVHNLFSQLAGEGIAADLFLGLEGGLQWNSLPASYYCSSITCAMAYSGICEIVTQSLEILRCLISSAAAPYAWIVG